MKLNVFMKEADAPLLVCQRASASERGAHSAAPLDCEITVSISFLNVMYTSMFICTAVANEAARVGNASEA